MGYTTKTGIETQPGAVEEAADINGISQMCKEIGFEDVRVTHVPLPGHLRTWLATELLDEGESVDEYAGLFVYYRVEAKQGAFGVFFGAYPALDLEGSGVALRDLEPQFAAEMPSDFPQVVGLTGEREQLLRLLQLMAKNQSGE